jgi:hypothetical protein
MNEFEAEPIYYDGGDFGEDAPPTFDTGWDTPVYSPPSPVRRGAWGAEP